jgi:hypothetical protein
MMVQLEDWTTGSAEFVEDIQGLLVQLCVNGICMAMPWSTRMYGLVRSPESPKLSTQGPFHRSRLPQDGGSRERGLGKRAMNSFEKERENSRKNSLFGALEKLD